MNANKKNIINDGWILCPSKTFPGKFYYFNVLNGEAAWSLGDAEQKKIMKKDDIPKVSESHHHPEPTSPPTEPMASIPKFSLQHPTPVFGQPVFPKSHPNNKSNVIWTPIHIQVPIVLTPENMKPKLNQDIKTQVNQELTTQVNQELMTQVNQQFKIRASVKQKTMWEFNKELFIHASRRPLSHRIVNYEKPVINFDQDNKIENKQQADHFCTLTPKSEIPPKIASKSVAWNCEQVFQGKSSLSYSDLKPRNQRLIREPMFNVEVPSQTLENIEKHIAPKVNANKCDYALTFDSRNTQIEPYDSNRNGFEITSEHQNIQKHPKGFGIPNFHHYNSQPKACENNAGFGLALNHHNIQNEPKFSGNKSFGLAFDSINTQIPPKASVNKSEFGMAWNHQNIQVVPSCGNGFGLASDYQNTQIEANGIGNRNDFGTPLEFHNIQTNKGNIDNFAIAKDCNTHNQSKVHGYKRGFGVAFDSLNTQNLPKEREREKERVIHSGFDMTFGTQIGPKDDSNKTAFGVAEHQNSYENDLRTVLMVKKRKSCEEIGNNKQKTDDSTPRPKKRVSFKLDHEDKIDDDVNDMEFKDKHSATIQALRELAGQTARTDQWYIVVDTEVLLDEFGFLDSFVQIDPQCRLVLPPSVAGEVRGLSRGAPGLRDRVGCARTLVRRFSCAHIIVQSEEGVGLKSPPNDAILKSCVEAMDQNIHVVLITKDLELLTTAKCYPIHCYHVHAIKNGLAPKPKTYKQNMKITIRNTEVNSIENDPVENAQNTFEEEFIENQILQSYKQTNQTQCDWNFSNENSMNLNNISNISNANSKDSIENSKFSITPNKSSLTFNEYSENSKQNSMMNNDSIVTNPRILLMMNSQNDPNLLNSINSEDNSKMVNTVTYSQINSMMPEHPSFHSLAEADIISNDKNLTDWRYPPSDTTEMTIDCDMKNLNLKDKYYRVENTTLNKEKPLKKSSYFQTKNDSQLKSTTSQYFQNGHENKCTPHFEKNKKEPQFENGIGKSIFEVDTLKEAEKLKNLKLKSNAIDLSEFYVKSQIMEINLKDRMDEWVCSYKQIMEDFLTRVLEKCKPVKSMPPPWSLYEALQCAKAVFKNHSMLKDIVSQLCEFLYETDYRMDKIKMAITPDEFIKAFGCGIHLVKYLQKIQDTTEFLDSKQHLTDMLEQIQNPATDFNEPIVKAPVVPNSGVKEVRQNFVKTRSEIINYLKRHYPQWQGYEDMDKTKIVRTFGRDLNMLKLERLREVKKEGAKNYVATENVDVGKNYEVTMEHVDVEKTNNVSSITTNNKESKSHGIDDKTKNIGVFVVKEVNRDSKQEKSKLIIDKHDLTYEKKLQNIKTTKLTNSYEVKNVDRNAEAKTSILDFAIPKDTKNLIDKNERKEKFKMSDDILRVQFTIPNNCNDNLQNSEFCNDKNTNQLELTKGANLDIERSDCIPKLGYSYKNNKNDHKIQENNSTNKNDNKIDTEKQIIKIVRNIYLIDKFEKKLKERKSHNLEDLDCSPISSCPSSHGDDDDVTHYSVTNECNVNKNYHQENTDYNFIGHSHNDDQKDKTGNDVNVRRSCVNHPRSAINDQRSEMNSQNDINACRRDVNNHRSNGNHPRSHMIDKDDINHCRSDTNNHKSDENHPRSSMIDRSDGNHPRSSVNDPRSSMIDRSDINNPRSDGNDRKSDDMTNDSGFGNEIPHLYFVVKSFSCELESSLELIRTFIDGSLQEFREGRLSEDTKNMFRLKAFEANFLLTKFICRCGIFAQREINVNHSEGSSVKNLSKNAEGVLKCLDQAEVLKKALNTILSATNKTESLADLNSSMSLNLSS